MLCAASCLRGETVAKVRLEASILDDCAVWEAEALRQLAQM